MTASRFRRKPDSIAAEARLDGFYVIRTSLPAEPSSADEAVRAYKDLARVERAFRSLKTDRSADPPDPPLDRAAGARPCLPLHARLPRRVAPARGLGADLIPAHSVDRERPFRPIVNTESGDHEHALAWCHQRALASEHGAGGWRCH